MAMSGLGHQKPLVGAGWATSPVLSINEPRKQSSQLVWPPIQVLKADFTARAG